LSFSFVAASLRPVYCTSFAQGERHPQTHHVIRAKRSILALLSDGNVGRSEYFAAVASLSGFSVGAHI
jgi:hypothetical protein